MTARYVGIDPSTKTGIVALDAAGNVLLEEEIDVGLNGRQPDAEHMFLLIRAVIMKLQPDDRILIEGFGFASQQAVLLGGIGWGIRTQLHNRKMEYTEAAPSALKKFTGAKGNGAKEQVAVEVYKRWGFQHDSNNVTDAYVLAQIARALHGLHAQQLTKFQLEVIQAIRNPSAKRPRSNKTKQRKGEGA